MPPKATKKSQEMKSDPNHVFSEGDIVLGKVKGYPNWPGQIVKHDSAPPKVLKEKPPKGKNLNLVHSWLPARDIALLTPREIEAFLSDSKKKKGELFEAYNVAKDPVEWNRRRADVQAEWEELQAQLANEEDQLASEEDEHKAEGKKRKRPAQADKPAKGAEKKKATKAKKDDDAPVSKKAKTAAAASDDPAETVKSWRHKLQKVFLGKTDPAAEEMSICAEYFDAMENFEMKEEWLRESKLNKVLKRIALMKDGVIPDEDKYSFRERSSQLASKWAKMFDGPGNESPAPAAAGAATSGEAAASNGDAAKDEESAAAPAEEDKKDEAEPAAPVEEKKGEDAPMQVDEQPKENGVEGDKQADAPADEPKKDDAPAAEASA
ncbi:hypothetical protein JCM10295v2_004448 [Rhodotorula toruloides]